ncbi:MAG: hypothetical protein WBC33_10375 [Conexibacter sp.]
MRLKTFAAVVLIAGLPTLAGCGGSTTPKTSSNEQDPARADRPVQRHASDDPRSALIGRRDLTPEWVPRRPLPSGERCEQWLGGATKRLASPRFNSALVDIEQTLGVFPDADASGRAYRRLNASATQRCMRSALHRRLLFGAYTFVGSVTVARIESIGTRSRAIRYMAPLVSEFGQDPGFIDVINTRVGRAASSLVVVIGQKELSDADYAKLAETVEQHLESVFS